MKTLVLLRHAKSDGDNIHDVDHDRGLSKRGEKDISEIALRLLKKDISPKILLSSSANRAVSTSKIFIENLGLSPDILKIEPQLYLAIPSDILSLIKKQESSTSELLIVGHNPGLTLLSNKLLPDFHLDNLPTTGIVAIRYTAKNWVELSPTRCSLLYYDFPKN